MAHIWATLICFDRVFTEKPSGISCKRDTDFWTYYSAICPNFTSSGKKAFQLHNTNLELHW